MLNRTSPYFLHSFILHKLHISYLKYFTVSKNVASNQERGKKTKKKNNEWKKVEVEERNVAVVVHTYLCWKSKFGTGWPKLSNEEHIFYPRYQTLTRGKTFYFKSLSKSSLFCSVYSGQRAGNLSNTRFSQLDNSCLHGARCHQNILKVATSVYCVRIAGWTKQQQKFNVDGGVLSSDHQRNLNVDDAEYSQSNDYFKYVTCSALMVDYNVDIVRCNS
jgi:hypothetical protein